MEKSDSVVVIDPNKDYFERTEIYDNFYICPSCKYNGIMNDFRFCPSCGKKFEWVSSILKQ